MVLAARCITLGSLNVMEKERGVIRGCAAKAWHDADSYARESGAIRLADMPRRGLPGGCGPTSFSDCYSLTSACLQTPAGFLDEVPPELRDVTETKTFRAGETLTVTPMPSVGSHARGRQEAIPAVAPRFVALCSQPIQGAL